MFSPGAANKRPTVAGMIGDFFDFGTSHGFGGLIVLAGAGILALMIVLTVALAAAKLSRAFANGWREAGAERRAAAASRETDR